MEGNKQKGTSSSLASELFGSKESRPSSSSGIFGSIFSSPSSKVLGRESLRSELNSKIANNETWISKIGIQDNFSKGNGSSEAQNGVNKDISSIYQDQRFQPCPLSSSIHYGGREDIYSNPQSTQNGGYNSMHRNGEDDTEFASRGNWWQGSLYY